MLLTDHKIKNQKEETSKMNQTMGEIWSLFGPKLASILFMWAMIQSYLPHQFHTLIKRLSDKFVRIVANLFNPYIEVRFFEYSGGYMRASEAFSAIEHYLTSKSSKQARKLKGEFVRQSVVLKMDEFEEVFDEFEGIKVVWSLRKTVPVNQTMSFYPAKEKRYYLLTFHRSHGSFIRRTYLTHVLEKGKAVALRKRQRKLYTNCTSDGDYDKNKGRWSHVIFEHPASFNTLAMDPDKKKEIIDDLTTFTNSKEYYARIGKPWKRGYLLYGPPGTGKSTLIAAIANFLSYDIYDIELTAVQTNAELRKLLIGITSKSVVVIEDIDCSIELTGHREAKSNSGKDEKEKGLVTALQKKAEGGNQNKDSKVTLSGLLNFIDGIWSASSGERLIIFTTNYVEKLDQALIRRGRMDMHIELSYCGFEGFKVFAKNYLGLESHDSFDTIGSLLEETNITPADVAENLMPKVSNEDAERCLERLIHALSSKKEEEALMKEETGTTATDESSEEDSSKELEREKA